MTPCGSGRWLRSSPRRRDATLNVVAYGTEIPRELLEEAAQATGGRLVVRD